ncbi:MAG: sulfurtransferase TusA family protein [Candidatus Bathyarchaeota archaeon]|nr:sulfurtransferase TusA family protein [Candidatus Bathyarchaeota archaeon]
MAFSPIIVNLFLTLNRETLGKTLKKNAKADRTLDCLGLFCPEPVYRTRLELDKMKVGETLEIWADDPAAERDIQSLTKRLGHEIVETRKEGSKLYFLIKKGR